MKRTIVLMSLVLLLQLGLAAGLYLAEGGSDTGMDGGKAVQLLPITVDRVDSLQIVGDGQDLQLTRTDGHWQLPGHFDAPADGGKVDSLLATLTAIQRPWPVAETGDAAKRFKVDDDTFERKLEFKAGDKVLATLLIGSSPGYRKVHARLAGEKQVYDIPFSSYQASLKPADWVDKQQLQLKPDQVSAVDLPDASLVRQDGKLQLTGLKDGEQTAVDPARHLLSRLAGLTIEDVVGQASADLPKPVLKLTVELKDGQKLDYAFAKGDKPGQALLQVSGHPYRYQIVSSLLDQLQKTTRTQLVQHQDKTNNAASSSAAKQAPQPHSAPAAG